MKISPIAQASGQPGQLLGSAEVGRTANPVKLERARAIARGETLPQEETGDPQADRVKPNVRSIKMRTNHSPGSEGELLEALNPETPAQPVAEDPVNPTLESNEQAAVEVTQPLSPQFAALAKQKRALQVKERELQEREKALSAAPAKTGDADFITRLKSQPLSVLQEHGVTYDQLTEAILSGSDSFNPEIHALKAEIKALKEGVDKNFTERDTQAEQAALSEMGREAERLAMDGDTFELIRETKSVPLVKDLIWKTYVESGKTEILDVHEAMQLIEGELLRDAEKFASLKKVQSKFAAPQEQSLQSQPQKQMRTLTARDTATPALSRKARAMAAFNGTNKR